MGRLLNSSILNVFSEAFKVLVEATAPSRCSIFNGKGNDALAVISG
jgi:hypothetical protein